MSQQEFDNYLSLLSNMLRLNRKQRAAIADEFRSHLEDRLEDLLSRGISREQAIQMALEEFGDAAGLAGQLSFVSSISRKRWIMRVSALSLAASVLLGIGLLSLWPEARQAVAPSNAIAQSPPAETATEGNPAAAKPAPLTDKQIDDELLTKLNERIDINFENISLASALKNLQEDHNLQFFIDVANLKDAGIEPETTNITISLNQLSTRTVLRLMLKQLNLTYVPGDGLITITTPEAANSVKLVRVYNCRDILFSRNHFLGTAPGTESSVGTYEYSSPQQGMMGGMGGGGGGAGGGFFALGDEPSSGPSAMTPQMGGMGGGGAGSASGGGFSPQQAAALQAQYGGRAVAPQGTHQRRAHQLMTLITTTVVSETWSDAGGDGTIFEFDGLIVVNQTAAIHQEVENVLKMLRDAAQTNPPGMANNLLHSYPGMPGMSMMPGMMSGPPGMPGMPAAGRPRTDSGYSPPGVDPNTGAPYNNNFEPGSSSGYRGPSTPSVPDNFNGPGATGSPPGGGKPGGIAPPGGALPGSAGPAGSIPGDAPPAGVSGAGGLSGGTGFGSGQTSPQAPPAGLPNGPRLKKPKAAGNSSPPAATPQPPLSTPPLPTLPSNNPVIPATGTLPSTPLPGPTAIAEPVQD